MFENFFFFFKDQQNKELSGRLLQKFHSHTKCVRALAALDDGDLISGSNDKTIKIWNVANGTVKRTLAGGSSSKSFLILDNNCLISAGSKNIINL
jgi:WD40 repeat protein